MFCFFKKQDVHFFKNQDVQFFKKQDVHFFKNQDVPILKIDYITIRLILVLQQHYNNTTITLQYSILIYLYYYSTFFPKMHL